MNSPVIGFIGLGAMGLPMASRLAQAGFALVVQDSDKAREAALAQRHGAQVRAAQGAASFAEVDVLITMLPNSAVVESVLLAGGLARSLKPATLVIDMSSSEPLRTRALAQELAALGLAFIDAPVSGGVKRAVEGTLAVMVGGDAALLERARPVLSAMGSTIIAVGPVGAAHAAKALNNYVSAAGLVAVVEALHAAEAFGIDPGVMTDVLNNSTGKNFTTENKVRQFMLSGNFGSGFALQLMAKDLRIAMGLAQALGQDAPLGHACLQLWEQAAKASTPATDHTAMYQLLRTSPRAS